MSDGLRVPPVRVVVLDDYQDCAAQFGPWSRIAEQATVDFVPDHLIGADLLQRAADAQIVVAMRERTPFPREVLAALPNLRLLITTASGNAAIDLDAARDLGIVVCGTRSGGGNGVTEHTWALILALAKNIVIDDQSVKNGGWQTSVSTQLDRMTLGLVGLGGLGTRMLPIAQAFGMKILAWSQNLDPDRARALGVEPVSKDDLFRESDVVSIHLRMSDRTRGLVGRAEFDLMRPTSFFINTSRGPIVDEPALVDALRERRIAGAGLDVFQVEPLPAHHPLRSLSNVVTTPHTAYVTSQNYEVFFADIVEDIVAYLGGEPIRVITPTGE